MSNSIHNYLRLITIHPYPEITAVIKKFRAEIEAVARSVVNVGEDADKESFALNISFITLNEPPTEVYKQIEKYMVLNNVGTAVLEADAVWTSECDHYDTRYSWRFNGDEYKVIKTNLTYSKEEISKCKAERGAARVLRGAVRDEIDKLQAKRDGIDQAIEALKIHVLDEGPGLIPF